MLWHHGAQTQGLWLKAKHGRATFAVIKKINSPGSEVFSVLIPHSSRLSLGRQTSVPAPGGPGAAARPQQNLPVDLPASERHHPARGCDREPQSARLGRGEAGRWGESPVSQTSMCGVRGGVAWCLHGRHCLSEDVEDELTQEEVIRCPVPPVLQLPAASQPIDFSVAKVRAWCVGLGVWVGLVLCGV